MSLQWNSPFPAAPRTRLGTSFGGPPYSVADQLGTGSLLRLSGRQAGEKGRSASVTHSAGCPEAALPPSRRISPSPALAGPAAASPHPGPVPETDGPPV